MYYNKCGLQYLYLQQYLQLVNDFQRKILVSGLFLCQHQHPCWPKIGNILTRHRHVTNMSPTFLPEYLMQVCKPCHYALVEAVDPFKLHPMSMAYKYEVFERLLRLLMGIWLHTHTVTTTDASPDLERLVEILPDESVQTMQLCFDWGCRTFQTASHVHVMYIWGIWAPSQVVDGHMASH